MRNIAQEVAEARKIMSGFGFRPVMESDLRPGQKLIMVEVERFTVSHGGLRPPVAPGCTEITLDEVPIGSSKAEDGHSVVFYHCTMPLWGNQCFVPLTQFIYDAYVDGPYGNDTRYYVRKN